MKNLTAIFLLFFVFPSTCFTQASEEWVHASTDKWPTIVLTNHVLYKNGDRYVHPSFEYAANGFLIDTGSDTLAATVKHALWVARNTRTPSVEVNADLASWVMKPKGGIPDSVVIDKLINEDSTEVREGELSTILERDWLVFSLKYSGRHIHPLKPRYRKVQTGEKIYIVAYTYDSRTVNVLEGSILESFGLDILIDLKHGTTPGLGISGSPVLDANGYLIGIYSNTTTHQSTGKNISVAVSTEYLRNVLERKPGLNSPKKDYGELIFQTVLKGGTKQAIDLYQKLAADPANYYIYNLRSANRNGLRETGEKLIELQRFKDAIDILEFNVKVNPWYYRDYNLLARAWDLSGNRIKAIEYYRISADRFTDEKENEAFEQLRKLE